jgi:hypothetical protein
LNREAARLPRKANEARPDARKNPQFAIPNLQFDHGLTAL